MSANAKKSAFHFVLMIGAVSLFADAAYEGARSVTGPFLAQLGANGMIVGIVAGLGELLSYSLRIFSGRLADKTGQFWPITIFGYAIQMIAVPLLALAGSWQVAALLIIVERIGKGTRKPSSSAMLSRAGDEIGQGWAFGLHETLDQFGALVGPLAIGAVLVHHGRYQQAFAILTIPAAMTVILVLIAYRIYPAPGKMHAREADFRARNLPANYWIYLAGASLVAAGFPDFSLMSFHFGKAHILDPAWIPVFYAMAMGTSGAGSLAFGKWFDRKGIGMLIPLTMITVFFVPLAFLGGFWGALLGCALWGLGMGVHESIIPAAVATMVPIQRRASSYGIFTAAYGISWFIGSVIIGALYDVSMPALIAFSVLAELAALPFFFLLSGKRLKKS